MFGVHVIVSLLKKPCLPPKLPLKRHHVIITAHNLSTVLLKPCYHVALYSKLNALSSDTVNLTTERPVNNTGSFDSVCHGTVECRYTAVAFFSSIRIYFISRSLELSCFNLSV
jgi:hypothetical protein